MGCAKTCLKARAETKEGECEVTIEEIEQSLKTVADGQAVHETRLARLEDAFQKVAMAIEQLTALATLTDERLDTNEEARIHSDARLDALIDSQIQITHRFDQMTEHAGRIDTHLDALATAQTRTDDQIKALIAAQVRTDEQIRLILSKNGQA